MSLPKPQTFLKHIQIEPPRASDPRKTRQIEPPRARILDPCLKSSPAPAQSSSHPRINLSPNSDPLRPTSVQFSIIKYVYIISHDSSAPHSYHPTMGRRQRRQPISPATEPCEVWGRVANCIVPLTKFTHAPRCASSPPPRVYAGRGHPSVIVTCNLENGQIVALGHSPRRGFTTQ